MEPACPIKPETKLTCKPKRLYEFKKFLADLNFGYVPRERFVVKNHVKLKVRVSYDNRCEPYYE